VDANKGTEHHLNGWPNGRPFGFSCVNAVVLFDAHPDITNKRLSIHNGTIISA
jgi:hypothetical protein